MEGEYTKNKVQFLFIQHGKQQRNTYIERYNRAVKYVWLNQYLSSTIPKVQKFVTRWFWDYNERPNMDIGSNTKAEACNGSLGFLFLTSIKNMGITVRLW